MKTINTNTVFILLTVFSLNLTSCNPVSPDKVVQRAWLNTNNVTTNYSPKFFGQLRELKSKGNITVFKDNEVTKGTAVEYVNQLIIVPHNENLQKVEDLPEKEDTKALKAASLELFQYSKEIFESDYLDIATMIDKERPDMEINIAIEDLFLKHDPKMETLLNRLDELVIPYAEKHNIPIKTVNNQPH